MQLLPSPRIKSVKFIRRTSSNALRSAMGRYPGCSGSVPKSISGDNLQKQVKFNCITHHGQLRFPVNCRPNRFCVSSAYLSMCLCGLAGRPARAQNAIVCQVLQSLPDFGAELCNIPARATSGKSPKPPCQCICAYFNGLSKGAKMRLFTMKLGQAAHVVLPNRSVTVM